MTRFRKEKPAHFRMIYLDKLANHPALESLTFHLRAVFNALLLHPDGCMLPGLIMTTHSSLAAGLHMTERQTSYALTKLRALGIVDWNGPGEDVWTYPSLVLAIARTSPSQDLGVETLLKDAKLGTTRRKALEAYRAFTADKRKDSANGYGGGVSDLRGYTLPPQSLRSTEVKNTTHGRRPVNPSAPPPEVAVAVAASTVPAPRLAAPTVAPDAATPDDLRQSVSKPGDQPSPLARVETLCFTQGYGPLAPKWYPKIKQLGEITDVELDYARRKVADIVSQENRTRGNPGLLVDILVKERIAGKQQGKSWLGVSNSMPVKPLHPVRTATPPISDEQRDKNKSALKLLRDNLAKQMGA